MREYNFRDIIDVSKQVIQFNDGYILDLEDCRKEWAKKRSIPLSETMCVGLRNIDSDIPYFIFCDNKNEIRVNFRFNGLFKKKYRKKKFIEFQNYLNKMAYYTYDES